MSLRRAPSFPVGGRTTVRPLFLGYRGFLSWDSFLSPTHDAWLFSLLFWSHFLLQSCPHPFLLIVTFGGSMPLNASSLFSFFLQPIFLLPPRQVGSFPFSSLSPRKMHFFFLSCPFPDSSSGLVGRMVHSPRQAPQDHPKCHVRTSFSELL